MKMNASNVELYTPTNSRNRDYSLAFRIADTKFTHQYSSENCLIILLSAVLLAWTKNINNFYRWFLKLVLTNIEHSPPFLFKSAVIASVIVSLHWYVCATKRLSVSYILFLFNIASEKDLCARIKLRPSCH